MENKTIKVTKEYKAKLLIVVEVILTGPEGGTIIFLGGFFLEEAGVSLSQPTIFLKVPHPSGKTIATQHR